MNNYEKIRIAIIDDTKESIDDLVESLGFIGGIEICGTATRYKQAIDLIIREKPDLIFLDIVMPGKDGFELLSDLREKRCELSVIFYTAYDKYVIHALREQALDYILKPIDQNQLKDAIDRYRSLRKTQPVICPLLTTPNLNTNFQKIALPTFLGLQFLEKNGIVLFSLNNGGGSKSLIKLPDSSGSKSPFWEVMLTDSTRLKLTNSITAEKILKCLPKEGFFQINQSCIINLTYLNGLVYKTRECLLMPPYDIEKLTVSRIQFALLKDIYDVF